MKLKMIVVDLELSRSQKQTGAAGLALAAALVAGSALADVPKEFVPGEMLKAADLNENFNALDGRLAATEEALAAVEEPKTSIVVAAVADFTAAVGAFTRVPYTTVAHDELSEFDVATSTFTASTTGDYLVCAALTGPATGNRELDLFVNGVRDVGFAQSTLTVSGCVTVKLQNGDDVDVRIFSGGGAVTQSAPWTWLRISRI